MVAPFVRSTRTTLRDPGTPPPGATECCYFCGGGLSSQRNVYWGKNSARPYCDPAHLAKGETYVLERMQEATRRTGV